MIAREDLIRMAREAGIWQGDHCEFVANSEEVLEAFAELVAAAEREACAKACEDLSAYDEYDPGESFAAAIRARGTP